MSIQTVARKFVEMCNQGKNFDVMHAMYAPDIVSVEASGEETAGKTPVIQKSERWQANNTIGGEKVRGPFFNGPNQFAVHFTFEVTPKATGQRIMLEEVGLHGQGRQDQARAVLLRWRAVTVQRIRLDRIGAANSSSY